MSEIAASEGGGGSRLGKGKVRGKKVSTRVDMTPMVDLAFLLITFFMLATTLSKPNAMQFAAPVKEKDKPEDAKEDALKASKVLSIFMGKNNQVFLLDGLAPDDDKAPDALKEVRYGKELRDGIFAAKQRVNSAFPKDDKGNEPFIVVIKPTPVSTYRNLVDVLDEMAITQAKRYAMVDELTAPEKKLLGDRITPDQGAGQ